MASAGGVPRYSDKRKLMTLCIIYMKQERLICQLPPILIQVHKQQKAVSEGVCTPFKPVNVTTNDNSTFPCNFGCTRIIGISLQAQS